MYPSTDPTPTTEQRTPTILVGIDGSPSSDAAVRWAADEAKARGAELILVHAVESTSLGLWVTTDFVRGILREAAQPQIDAAMRIAAEVAPDVPTRGRVLIGSPTRALEVMSRGADLTVVGRTGRNAFARAWYGSVTWRLFSHAASPVLSVPPSAEPGAAIKRVVVGVYSFGAAIAFARAEAKRLGVPYIYDDATIGEPTDLVVISQHEQHRGLSVRRLDPEVANALHTVPCAVAVVPEPAHVG